MNSPAPHVVAPDLAKLTWVSSDTFDVLGQAVLIRTNTAELTRIVRLMMDSFPNLSGGAAQPDVEFSVVDSSVGSNSTPAKPFGLYIQDVLFRETISFWKLARLLEWRINVHVAQTVVNYLILHAGSLSINGSGVMLPGSSRSGKTSLTMSLLLRGGGYLSDEITPISLNSGWAHAYPKPLSCRNPDLFPALNDRPEVWFGPELGRNGAVAKEESGGWTPVWFVHPEDVRPGSVSDPVELTHVVFPDYAPDSAPSLRPISRPETMKRLIIHSINFPELGDAGFHKMADLSKQTQAFVLTGSDLPACTDLVMELVTG